MKVVICDDKINLMRDINYEVNTIKAGLPDADVAVYEYDENNLEGFYQCIENADGIINTVVQMDKDCFDHAKRLKVLALNSVGFNTTDIQSATAHRVMVCPAAEYCTDEVAEHTMALIFSLSRGLRTFIEDTEKHVWDYHSAGVLNRIKGQTIAIFGYGQIGKAVASRCRAMGINVMVVSEHMTPEQAQSEHVILADWEEAFAKADILSNHMPLRAQSKNYFDYNKFSQAKRRPIFINTGRGASVVEADLARALDEELIRGAGLDVLQSEIVDFDKVPFLGRNNVIITPHVAFYSGQSELALQTMSCNSIIYGLTGQYDKIARLLNRQELG